MEEIIPLGSNHVKDEGSLMSKEYNFEDFEDDYDTNPWEDVQKK